MAAKAQPISRLPDHDPRAHLTGRPHTVTEVLRDHDLLANSNRISLLESLGLARLALWDEAAGRLVTLAEAQRLQT